MLRIRKPCKIPRRCRRKYLRHSLLILCRDRIIIEEEIPAHILSDSLAGLLRPLMILRRMIHDKIHTYIDVLLVACRCKAL